MDMITGADDHTETFSMLYADARGVCRVYQMSLDGAAWKIWGQAGPGFFQRFEGSFSDDATRITAGGKAPRTARTGRPTSTSPTSRRADRQLRSEALGRR
jgi:hypothetical protein